MSGVALANLPNLVAAGLPEGPTAVASVVRADPRTGRLVRSLVPRVVPGRPRPKSASAVSGQFAQTVERIARQNQLSAQLIHSVIQVESNYDPYAVSPKGALGLMQLIPSTARRFGVSDVFDPADNIQGGARYLKYLLELYKGDKALALAAYNAGEGAVSRYGGVPPFPETWNYVTRVRKRLEETAAPDETAAPVSAVQRSEAIPVETGPAAVYNPIREVMEADGKVHYVSH
jgi:soluble lytic murein transglycosylase-like protein